jgi:Notch-like protein
MLKLLTIILCVFALSLCFVDKCHSQSEASYVCQQGNRGCIYGTCEILTPFTYSCHCNEGFEGTKCDTASTSGSLPCASNPCNGDSTCVDQGTAAFLCFCPPDKTGKTCTQHTGNCRCENGATCTPTIVNGVTSYTCNCAAGFYGEFCHFTTLTGDCSRRGCQNGGSCNILGNCNCPAGFIGQFCEGTVPIPTTPAVTVKQVAVCGNGICLNGGECFQLSKNIGVCSCRNGYTGLFCNIAPIPTTPNPLIPTTPGTTVTTSANLVRCINVASPCQNGGTCFQNPSTNALSCQCLPNFTGTNCETTIPFCTNSPCQNGGTCVPGTGNAGSCTCATGFGGDYCDVTLSCPANNNPCQNNQPCLLINNLPICLCQAGLSAPYCT